MKNALIFLLLLSSTAVQAQEVCSHIFKPTVTVAEFEQLTGKSVYDFIFRYTYDIDAQVLAGTKTPTWNDFEVLNKLLVNLKSLKEELKDKPETAHMLEGMAKEIKTMLLERSNVQEMLQARHTMNKNNTTYQPTERDMKVAYQKLVFELNRALPKELRVPMSRFKQDTRLAKMNAEAEAYMKGVEKNFEALFQRSDYGNYKEFEKRIRESTDPVVQKAIRLIDGDQLQVVMRRPISGRFWVPKVGFQNQFVTGSSKGELNADSRNTAERNLYNLEDQQAYSAHDPEFKPKYGTLSVKQSSDIAPDLDSSQQYGADIYGFKTEKIKDRVSVYTTDSLYPGQSHEPHKIWDFSFIPWKHRLFLVPFLHESLAKNSFRTNNPVGLENTTELSLGRYYFETQILGPVRLDDVSTFTFTQLKSAPKGEFLRELIKHNIAIYDGTAGLGPNQLKKWTPTAEDLAAP